MIKNLLRQPTLYISLVALSISIWSLSLSYERFDFEKSLIKLEKKTEIIGKITRAEKENSLFMKEQKDILSDLKIIATEAADESFGDENEIKIEDLIGDVNKIINELIEIKKELEDSYKKVDKMSLKEDISKFENSLRVFKQVEILMHYLRIDSKSQQKRVMKMKIRNVEG